MEDSISKALYDLNKDYIDIYFSNEYQKTINKNFKKISFIQIFKYLFNGYLFERVASIYRKPKQNINYCNQVIEKNIIDLQKNKIVIYTVVTGGYDNIKEPLYINPFCDYYLISDKKINDNSKWKYIDINEVEGIHGLSNLEKARYLKTHPHILFPNYDYSIWIDGNITIIADLVPLIEDMGNYLIGIHDHPCRACIYEEGKIITALGKAKSNDVKKQINDYSKAGFPSNYGLFETNVLLRKHNDELCKQIMELWWGEMTKYTKRDQLSLTYVLWSLKLESSFIYIIGPNTRKNPRFRVSSHN